MIKMTKVIKTLKIENRIALLNNRPKENSRIVQKLIRQYRNLTGKEYISVDSDK